ncbi:MAG TPA: protease pro-enzyme activation domain-containing protein [Gemmataceae bacterium]|nr:protease pro-enzyme activation domain-containing protein [Gemmataceae bacterium]
MATSQILNATVPLKGSRRFHRAGSEVLGQANRDEWVEVTIKTRRKAPLPEPIPGKPMKLADLVDKYGAESADLDKVSDIVSRFGLTVTQKDVARRAVHCVGPAAAMEKAFGVRLLRVKYNDILYRGRVGDVHLPPELAGIVTGVFGLDNRPMIKRRKPLRLQTAAHGTTLPPANQRSWFTPPELATAYKFPSGDGEGQKIAILEFGGHYISEDLKSFFQLIGLADPLPTVNVKNVHPNLIVILRPKPAT